MRLQILDAGGHFGRRLPMIRRTLNRAVSHVADFCDLGDVDVVVHPKDQGPDQWPVEAFTLGPHNIHISIERSQLSGEELEAEVFRCAVHELHHAWRWRHMGRRTWCVGEAIVLEGLAVLADHLAAGPHDATDRPLHDPCLAVRQLEAIMAEPVRRHRVWLHSPEPSQPGGVSRIYSVGRLVMRAATVAEGIDPWVAARRPTRDLMEAGLGALRLLRAPRSRQAV
jgi:hypothetical protein